jgi:hypothetical protein
VGGPGDEEVRVHLAEERSLGHTHLRQIVETGTTSGDAGIEGKDAEDELWRASAGLIEIDDALAELRGDVAFGFEPRRQRARPVRARNVRSIARRLVVLVLDDAEGRGHRDRVVRRLLVDTAECRLFPEQRVRAFDNRECGRFDRQRGGDAATRYRLVGGACARGAHGDDVAGWWGSCRRGLCRRWVW